MTRKAGKADTPAPTLRQVGVDLTNELFTLRRLATVMAAMLLLGCLLAAGSIVFVRRAGDAASAGRGAARDSRAGSEAAKRAAEQGKEASEQARATSDFIRGCIDPAGECGARLAAGATAAAEQRKRDLEASLERIRVQQAADSARTLQAVESAIAQLAGAQDDRAELRAQVEQLIAEVVRLRGELANRQGSTAVSVPPPSSLLCGLLGSVGPALGCPAA